ncbi:uncharacterized protein [Ptychodera flava]|uniref:uncharacterized protein n=1 Tax=Ptychodera flava TaxID=63121 RepID=UPI00396A966D
MIATIVAASIIVVRKRKAKSMSGSSDVILNNRSYGNVVSDSANQGEGRVQPLTQKNAHSYEELHAVKEDYTKLQFQETRFMSGNAVKSGMQAATGKKAGESFKVIQDQSVSPNGSDNEYAYAKFDDIGVKTDNVDSSQGLSQKIQRGYNHGKNLLNPNHEGKTFERQQKQVPGNDAPQAEGHVVAAPEAELPKKYQASGDVMTENIAYESASDVNSGFIDNVIYESNADEENPDNVRHSNDLQTNCRGDSSHNHDSNKEVKYDGMVENIAYELTDDVEDYGDVYAEIADTGAENVDVEGGVDNILYESGTLENADDVEYYVLEGP